MRVIHVLECFAGGVFEFLSALTQGMPEHKYIIIYGKRENTPIDYQERFPENTIFIPWESAQREISPWKDMKALLELIKTLKKYINEASVIHLHSSKAGFLGRIAARLLRKSRIVLYTAHGASFLRKDVSKRKHLTYVWLEKIAGYFGGRIVACSNSEGEEFQKHKIKNIEVINNGIKVEALEKENIKEQEKEKLTIGTLARITYQKNPKQFNEIAEHFKENEKVRFLWIGDGELRDELKSSNIEITGWLKKEEAKEKLKEIDIYLSTSLWEGLPLSVLEAMALKKPVVLSNCVGNRDLVKSNRYLYEDRKIAEKSLEKLLTENQLREKCGKESRNTVETHFSEDRMIKMYKYAYQITMNR